VTAQQKAGRVNGAEGEIAGETTNKVNWKQICITIGYKKEHLREAESPRRKEVQQSARCCF